MDHFKKWSCLKCVEDNDEELASESTTLPATNLGPVLPCVSNSALESGVQPSNNDHFTEYEKTDEDMTPPPRNKKLNESGIVRVADVQFSSQEKRLKSFYSWLEKFPVKADDLARAGFYYIGPKDRVKCYACKKKILNWEPGDSAWSEHFRFSPKCPAVQAEQSAEYNIPTTCIAIAEQPAVLTTGDEPVQSKIPVHIDVDQNVVVAVHAVDAVPTSVDNAAATVVSLTTGENQVEANIPTTVDEYNTYELMIYLLILVMLLLRDVDR